MLGRPRLNPTDPYMVVEACSMRWLLLQLLTALGMRLLQPPAAMVLLVAAPAPAGRHARLLHKTGHNGITSVTNCPPA
jgi:hypothetical protein